MHIVLPLLKLFGLQQVGPDLKESNNELKTGFIICYTFSFGLLFLYFGEETEFLEKLRFALYICFCFGPVVGMAIDKSGNGYEEGRNGVYERRVLTSWVQ